MFNLNFIPYINNSVCFKSRQERFATDDMADVRSMNKIAQKNEYVNRSHSALYSSKILPNDLKRLSSETYEDSLKRAFWINPKDGKGYHLLDEGKTDDGKIKLRILDEEGKFLKNTTVKQPVIILSDVGTVDKYGKREASLTVGKNNLTHTDLIETVARRYNPFADYHIVVAKDFTSDKRYMEELLKLNAIYKPFGISCSYGMKYTPDKINEPAEILLPKCKAAVSKVLGSNSREEKGFKKLTKDTRVLFSAGNDGKNTINAYLLIKGIEGVGGLHTYGKVYENSASRNSVFTQHYEDYVYPVYKTDYGINMTGLYGTDYPLESDEKSGEFIDNLAGTSMAAPVRMAKLSLNEMMKDVF